MLNGNQPSITNCECEVGYHWLLIGYTYEGEEKIVEIDGRRNIADTLIKLGKIDKRDIINDEVIMYRSGYVLSVKDMKLTEEEIKRFALRHEWTPLAEVYGLASWTTAIIHNQCRKASDRIKKSIPKAKHTFSFSI